MSHVIIIVTIILFRFIINSVLKNYGKSFLTKRHQNEHQSFIGFLQNFPLKSDKFRRNKKTKYSKRGRLFLPSNLAENRVKYFSTNLIGKPTFGL